MYIEHCTRNNLVLQVPLVSCTIYIAQCINTFYKLNANYTGCSVLTNYALYFRKHINIKSMWKYINLNAKMLYLRCRVITCVTLSEELI